MATSFPFGRTPSVPYGKDRLPEGQERQSVLAARRVEREAARVAWYAAGLQYKARTGDVQLVECSGGVLWLLRLHALRRPN